MLHLYKQIGHIKNNADYISQNSVKFFDELAGRPVCRSKRVCSACKRMKVKVNFGHYIQSYFLNFDFMRRRHPPRHYFFANFWWKIDLWFFSCSPVFSINARLKFENELKIKKKILQPLRFKSFSPHPPVIETKLRNDFLQNQMMLGKMTIIQVWLNILFIARYFWNIAFICSLLNLHFLWTPCNWLFYLISFFILTFNSIFLRRKIVKRVNDAHVVD